MKMTIVCVRDRALDTFGRPFFTASLGAAVRSFEDECSRQAPDNIMSVHPDDFSLFSLGTFDDQTGVFECISPPLFICGAVRKEVVEPVGPPHVLLRPGS